MFFSFFIPVFSLLTKKLCDQNQCWGVNGLIYSSRPADAHRPLFKFCVKSPRTSSHSRSVATCQGCDQVVLCTGYHARCVWVTLCQAMPVLCQGWTSSSSQAAQERRIYLNPGFSCAASQEAPVPSPLPGTEAAVCGCLVGHRWGSTALWAGAEGFRGKGNPKGKAKE